MRVLITGGAGFIGQHLAHRLLALGDEVTVFDSFSPQVHGGQRDLPPSLAPHVSLIRGDVRNRTELEAAVTGQEAVVHLAAETGTGQSMYEVSRYTEVNLNGTANLAQTLKAPAASSLQTVVVASSRAIYGEGAYSCPGHGLVYPTGRDSSRLTCGDWDPRCPLCAETLTACPTPEDAPFRPTSYYGLTKQVQEQMLLLFGEATGIPVFALRYQNVYGPGQSLHNPYTGILAIFSGLARGGQPIQVFEDGQESRDFVAVEDIARATADCLRTPHAGGSSLNLGSGCRTTVAEVAERISTYYGGRSPVVINGAWRAGDIRHGCADIRRAHQVLDFRPQQDFPSGLNRFLEWASEQDDRQGGYTQSLNELRKMGFLHESRQDRNRYRHP